MATTTNYGWETPDDTDLVKDGALAMRTTANAIDSTLGTAFNNKLHAGLVLLKTQTIGSGVSSVTVTGAFSSTYDAYKIVISGGAGTADNALALRMGSTTSNYKFNLIYANFGGGVANATSSTGEFFPYIGGTTTSSSYMNAEVVNPYLTENTYATGYYLHATGAGTQTAILNDTTSYTSFTVLTQGGTITGGTIAVYGYAKD